MNYRNIVCELLAVLVVDWGFIWEANVLKLSSWSCHWVSIPKKEQWFYKISSEIWNETERRQFLFLYEKFRKFTKMVLNTLNSKNLSTRLEIAFYCKFVQK